MDIKINTYKNCPLSMAITVDEDTVITKNFGNWYEAVSGNTILMENCAFIDPEYANDAKKLGGVPHTRFGESVEMFCGFNVYPLYQFSAEKLRDLDEDGYAKYMKNYRENIGGVVKELDSIFEANFGIA